MAEKIARKDSSDEEDEDPPVPDDKPPSAIIKENGSINGKTNIKTRWTDDLGKML